MMLNTKLKNFLIHRFNRAVELNQKNIMDLLGESKDAYLLDLGCDDGEITIKVANKIKTRNIYGVDLVSTSVERARKKGIVVKKFDLNRKFDLKDESFDIIHANQVIEHISDSDNFISEIYRVLKKGGYAVISTENASSWCNIIASIMGWQIFSLTNISKKKAGIGNPLSLHKDLIPDGDKGSWCHVRIYNIKGLRDYFKLFGFKVECVKGAGYFPFPAFLGRIDKVHSHFMVFKIRK